MLSEKTYLEPRCDYDKFIVEETENHTKYNGWEIIGFLIEKYRAEGLSQEESEVRGIEWFDFNVEPLSNYYNISFHYPDISDLSLR